MAIVAILLAVFGQGPPARQFDSPDAHQGVAVSEKFVFTISNASISKHDKDTGEHLERWRASDTGLPLIHMNAGMVHDGRLYCAHSNYPHVPMTSSLEIFTIDPLEHVETHSFGSVEGSLTWIDRRDGYWWACFVHYDHRPPKDQTNEWSRFVQFDDEWHPIQSWAFPNALMKELKPYSLSGGAWGPDGRLYVSGHDRRELYALRLPAAGSVLEHEATVEVPFAGQAFVFDRSGTGLLYGIRRDKMQVVTHAVDALQPAGAAKPE